MTTHMTGTREEWLAARLELLEAEKELTRRSDELARQRQELPWVRIDKEYRFDTDEGSASLADLFRGRSQLLVYHFMFGPDYTGRLPVLLGDRRRLQRHRRAPGQPRRHADGRCRARRSRSCRRTSSGWAGRFPGRRRSAATSTPTSTCRFTEEQQREGGIEYNYRREPALATPHERPTQRRRRGGQLRGHDAAPTRPPTRASGPA